MLPLETKTEVRRLFYAEHLTMNTIAEKLGIHHDTVKSTLTTERLVHRPTFRSSQVDQYVPFIIKTLEDFPKLRSTRLIQMLRDRGYRGSVQQLRRRVKLLRPKVQRAFLPLTVFPGEQAQVDWGHFGTLTVGRAVRQLSCFIMVLAHSRYVYARFCFDQSMENFLACHVDAFRLFGGVPRVIRYDNLKSAVIERFGQAVRYNPNLLEMAGHYRFRPSACNPYSGHEKGRVERNVRYIRDNFFAGRHFNAIAEANAELSRWLSELCNVRPWPDDKSRTVGAVFLEEQERLLPLPEHDFGIAHPRPVASGKLPYIRFDRNDYSIPYQLVRRPLSLIVSERVVRILDGRTEVARHERTYDAGKRVRIDDHFAGLYEQKPGGEMNDGRAFVVNTIPETAKLFELMIVQGVPLAASTKKLISLIDDYGITPVRDAVREAVKREIAMPSFIAMRLAEREDGRAAPPTVPLILPDRPNVRDVAVTHHDLAAYDQLSSGGAEGAAGKDDA